MADEPVEELDQALDQAVTMANDNAAALVAAQRRVEELEAENERLKIMAFSPLGDNHHNAALCPYCCPDRERLIEEVRQARALPKDGER